MTDQFPKRFCTRCGSPIPEDSNFCPKCGMPTDGGEAPQQAYSPQTAYPQGMNPLGATPTLLLMYTVGALFLGILFIAVGTSLNEEMWTEILGDEFGPYDPVIKTLYMVYGICTIVSSGMAFLSYRYTKTLTHWKNAVTCCLAATLCILPLALAVFGIFMVLIGGLMTYRIHRYQKYFTS